MEQTRPILGVSACVWHGERVLVVKRGKAPNKNLWSLPGGHVELGETLAEAAARELTEETATRAELTHMVGCLDFIGRRTDGTIERHYVVAVFTGRWTGGTAEAMDDAADVAWRLPGELAALAMTEGTCDIIAKARALIE